MPKLLVMGKGFAQLALFSVLQGLKKVRRAFLVTMDC